MNSAIKDLETTPKMSPFVLALIANLVWINASEIFRYFVFVMPMMREAFPLIPNIAPMNLPVFLIWGLWDTILVLAATLLPFMAMKTYGSSLLQAIIYGTFVWMIVFVILWLGLYNMNLATLNILAVALPLAWLEMVIASIIVWWFTSKDEENTE